MAIKGVHSDEFKLSLQLDDYSCGARSCFMITQHLGVKKTYSEIKYLLNTDRKAGTNQHAMVAMFRGVGLQAAFLKNAGFHTDLVPAFAKGFLHVALVDEESHYIAVHGYDPTRDEVHLADPSVLDCADRVVSRSTFKKRWDHWGVIVGPRR